VVGVTDRPAPRSGVASFLVAVLAVGLVATGGTQRLALVAAAAGGAVIVAGVWLADSRLVYGLVALIGVVSVLAGVVIALTRPAVPGARAEVVPGLLGIAVLAAALAPVRAGWERYLLASGAGLLVVTLVVSGAIQDAPTVQLLTAGAATVLAWDLGEQAVNVREQVGRDAATLGFEALHGGATALVGAVGVGVALLVRAVGPTGIPLPALVLLLGAGVTLLVGLYN